MIPRIVSFLALVLAVSAAGEDDLVKNLPGLIFEVNFNTYSGYLDANDDKTWKMHYILTESRSNPATDPLLVWFNGGPGCSSVAGLFEELGPFQVNKNGQTLYENPYSWNLKANVLYLESPIGVGFSYDTTQDSFSSANDWQSANQNYHALADFFANVQPKYQNRTFFLSGESYAGIYIPMLTKLLVDGINNGTFPNNHFQGSAIGNGFMNVQYLQNSLVLWSAYHGRVSVDDWDAIKKECKTAGAMDVDGYDFTQNMVSVVGNGIDFVGINNTCGQLINPLITMPDNMFQYNYYQDCYDTISSESTGTMGRVRRSLQRSGKRAKRQVPVSETYETSLDINSNAAATINRQSTDPFWGYNCWNEDAVATYLNNRTVQDALHIPAAWRKQQNNLYRWRDCNDAIYDQYHITVNNTFQFFMDTLANVNIPNFRFLIYNGDVDTVCNYLGDAWHIRDVANAANLTSSPRKEWFFSQNDQIAGFNQRYSGVSGQGAAVTIDVLTVKGAGHMVPTDRPGPSAQMISNFMFPQATGVDYTNPIINSDPVLAPMLNTGNGGSSSTITPPTTTQGSAGSSSTVAPPTTTQGSAGSSSTVAPSTTTHNSAVSSTFFLVFFAVSLFI